MNSIEFKKKIDEIKLYNSFLINNNQDKIPNKKEIKKIEKELNVELPNLYKNFILTYGGGDIGYTNVFSLDRDSDFYIVTNNIYYVKNRNFIAVSSDETGGFYGYYIENSICSELIYYYDSDDETILKTNFINIYDYVYKIGLNND